MALHPDQTPKYTVSSSQPDFSTLQATQDYQNHENEHVQDERLLFGFRRAKAWFIIVVTAIVVVAAAVGGAVGGTLAARRKTCPERLNCPERSNCPESSSAGHEGPLSSLCPSATRVITVDSSVPTPTTSGCPVINGSKHIGPSANYTVKCSSNIRTADLAKLPVLSFDDCIAECDRFIHDGEPRCSGVAMQYSYQYGWFGGKGLCSLKSATEPKGNNAYWISATVMSAGS